MLKDYFPHYIKGKVGKFGIEIETEVKSYDEYPDGLFLFQGDRVSPDMAHELLNEDNTLHIQGLPEFVAKHDGSLRNCGIEYVFDGPLSYTSTLEALDRFAKVFDGVEFLQDQASTSVHVHLNVSYYSFARLGNIMTLWALYENVIVAFCDDFRHTNLFALPMRCAESTVDFCTKIFILAGQMNIHCINVEQQVSKYSAMNVSALCRFGSLEFRSLEGTTDVARIKKWVGIIKNLDELSEMYADPYKIIEDYRSNPDFLLNFLIGDVKADLIAKGVDFEAVTKRNLWYAGQIAMAVDDWADLDLRWSTKGSKKKPMKGYQNQDTEVILNEIYGWSPSGLSVSTPGDGWAIPGSSPFFINDEEAL